MKKIIICLLILLLASCSNKKMPPDAGSEAPKDTDTYIAKIEEDEDDILTEEETEPYDYYAVYQSLIPSFFVHIKASSELPDYPAGNLNDGTWNSWAEGAPDNGIGESFTITWDGSFPETVAGFVLKNGHGDLNYYSQNNRVKAFKIYSDGNNTETISIKDTINFEQYVFEKPVTVEEPV